MTGAIPWGLLEEEYQSYGEDFKTEIKTLIHSPEIVSQPNDRLFACNLLIVYAIKGTFPNPAFDAGKQFAKTFPNILDAILNSDFINYFGSKTNKSTNTTNSETRTETKTTLDNTLDFMRGIMDECTHLANFSVPVDPELAIIINATHDGYVPRQHVQPLTDIWPGSQVRYVDGGHVSAILFNTNVFRYAKLVSVH